MKRSAAVTALFGATLMMAGPALADAVVGQPAPAFSATDAAGKPVSLSQFKGKYVVLEWTNPECPFVVKHYGSGNMPKTQEKATAKNVAWVSIQTVPDASNAKAAAQLQDWQKSKNAKPTATIVDAGGKIGRAYKATATPHMFIVGPTGTLLYAGAIDSKPSANPDDIKTATNYVNQALDEALAGKPVSKPVTKAYGCSVKYPAEA